MSGTGLILLEDDAAEAWLAEARTPGWVAAEELTLRARLAREVAELEAKRASIQSELESLRSEALAAARTEGLEHAAHGVAQLERTMRQNATARTNAAASAVLAATEAVIREMVDLDPQLVVRRIEQLIAARVQSVQRIRVSPDVARAARQIDTRGFVLVADASLSGIDAVAELPGGQIDARLSTLLPVLAAEIEVLLCEADHG